MAAAAAILLIGTWAAGTQASAGQAPAPAKPVPAAQRIERLPAALQVQARAALAE